MKLKSFKIKNFRSYKEEISINFDNLTAIIGKNDVGKSTILEAMDIFFNEKDAVVKLEKNDWNIEAKETPISFTAIFEDLPSEITIDATNKTNLQDEHLLNDKGLLEIKKEFTSPTLFKIFIHALYPCNPECAELHKKKNTDLKKIVKALNIDCSNETINAVLRSSIWNHFRDNLQEQLTDVEINSKEGDTKAIWESIKNKLPVYSLFQSDRKNNDDDEEVQDPLKSALKEFFKKEQIQEQLNTIAEQVRNILSDVSTRTLAKLREMDPSVANDLAPSIPETANLKWADVFKDISITGDSIPVNKRGSGVKRLILLNFFRAEAERKLESNIDNNSIIYAIEEPETSQHTENQKKIIKALIDLSSASNTQIVITTHSPQIVKKLNHGKLRLISYREREKFVTEHIQYVLPIHPPSLNEVNYQAFEEISEEFHDELWGYLSKKAYEDFASSHTRPEDKWKEIKVSQWLRDKGCSEYPHPWKREKNGIVSDEIGTYQYFIRNFTHHPENRHNDKYSDDDLRKSIEEMLMVIRNLTP